MTRHAVEVREHAEVLLDGQRHVEVVQLRDDAALRARLAGYRQGICLMRDLDGRVGELQVDLVFPELLEALETTPGEERS